MPEKRGKDYQSDWFDEKALNINSFLLEEGDVVKIGRVRFKIAELFIEYQDDYNLDKPADIARQMSIKQANLQVAADVAHFR